MHGTVCQHSGYSTLGLQVQELKTPNVKTAFSCMTTATVGSPRRHHSSEDLEFRLFQLSAKLRKWERMNFELVVKGTEG
jgi:hypothetical protein